MSSYHFKEKVKKQKEEGESKKDDLESLIQNIEKSYGKGALMRVFYLFRTRTL